MSGVTTAAWTSRAVLGLVRGPRRTGSCLGRGYLDLGGYVLALVPPGLPRMPNGIACPVPPAAGEQVCVGGGAVRVGQAAAVRAVIVPGPVWEPVPVPRYRLVAGPGTIAELRRQGLRLGGMLTLDPVRLAGRGEGLTPAGDDLLCGYAAGLILWHGRRREAAAIAAAAAPRTTALAATLLGHAARGELPGPAHALVTDGDLGPLRSFGNSSGRALMAGLTLGCAGGDPFAGGARSPDAGAGPAVQRADELVC